MILWQKTWYKIHLYKILPKILLSNCIFFSNRFYNGRIQFPFITAIQLRRIRNFLTVRNIEFLRVQIQSPLMIGRQAQCVRKFLIFQMFSNVPRSVERCRFRSTWRWRRWISLTRRAPFNIEWTMVCEDDNTLASGIASRLKSWNFFIVRHRTIEDSSFPYSLRAFHASPLPYLLHPTPIFAHFLV